MAQRTDISGQHGDTVPKGALVIPALDHYGVPHWLSNNAGIKARVHEFVLKKRDEYWANKKLSEVFDPEKHPRVPAGNEQGGEFTATGGATAVDYRMEHQAPDHESGSSIHNLGGTYPEDFYGPHGAEYYGHYGQNNPMDVASVNLIQGLRGKPNASVKIYRAVPKDLLNQELIANYEKQKAAIQRRGRIPTSAFGTKVNGVEISKGMNSSAYYDLLYAEVNRLKALPEQPEQTKTQINPGDWVTINRAYAKEHGDSQLNGRYKILSKTVKAKDIFTDGNSVHEWGYDPGRVVKESFPGHAGRPGQVGGALPRDVKAAEPQANEKAADSSLAPLKLSIDDAIARAQQINSGWIAAPIGQRNRLGDVEVSSAEIEEKLLRREKYEACAVLNSKNVLLSYDEGSEDAVSIPGRLVNLSKKYKDWTIIHNHPSPPDASSGGSLSAADISTAIAMNLVEIRAVSRGPLGRFTFSLKRPTNGWPQYYEVEDKVQGVYKSLQKVFRGRINFLKLDKSTAVLAFTHAMMTVISKQLGWNYGMKRDAT